MALRVTYLCESLHETWVELRQKRSGCMPRKQCRPIPPVIHNWSVYLQSLLSPLEAANPASVPGPFSSSSYGFCTQHTHRESESGAFRGLVLNRRLCGLQIPPPSWHAGPSSNVPAKHILLQVRPQAFRSVLCCWAGPAPTPICPCDKIWGSCGEMPNAMVHRVAHNMDYSVDAMTVQGTAAIQMQ